MNHKQIIEELLDKADVKINGNRPWDIQVSDDRFYKRVVDGGSLGIGEAYMDKWWECEKIDGLFSRVLRADIEDQVKKNTKLVFWALIQRFFNMQTVERSRKVGEVHYDVGNDLYRLMLGKEMVYTCGYWKDSSSLDEAQEAKLDLVCKKIGLKKGMTVLDIGCGWGSFAKFAAERYGASVVGVTISEEQVKLAKEKVKDLSVEIRLQDYRKVDEKFDRIISLGMFEHVGPKNYRSFMLSVSKNLKDDGLFLLHTIGKNYSSFEGDAWFDKYIFPRGVLPSVNQIGASIEKLFVMEDWHNFSADYDKTLMCWYRNFTGGWDKIKDKYDERFYRMWTYYLLVAAGMFRARRNQLWQIVLSKKGVVGGYNSIR